MVLVFSFRDPTDYDFSNDLGIHAYTEITVMCLAILVLVCGSYGILVLL